MRKAIKIIIKNNPQLFVRNPVIYRNKFNVKFLKFLSLKNMYVIHIVHSRIAHMHLRV